MFLYHQHGQPPQDKPLLRGNQAPQEVVLCACATQPMPGVWGGSRVSRPHVKARKTREERSPKNARREVQNTRGEKSKKREEKIPKSARREVEKTRGYIQVLRTKSSKCEERSRNLREERSKNRSAKIALLGHRSGENQSGRPPRRHLRDKYGKPHETDTS